MRTFRTGSVTLCLFLLAAACSDDAGGGGASSPDATTQTESNTDGGRPSGGTVATRDDDAATATTGAGDGPTTAAGNANGGGSTGAAAGDCPQPEAVVPPEGPSESAEVVQAGSDGEPRVEMVVYPRPDDKGNPWSQWGQGVVTSDGRFLSAMGDHLGVDGDSYLFVYDPAVGELTRFADVGEVVGHQPGDWGYGKVHAQMVAGPCGEVYAATYWGTRRDIRYNDRYTGDELLRIDPATLEVTPLGAPVPEHGIPSMAAAADGRLYVEAVDPLAEGEDQGRFAVIDPTTDPPTVAFEDDGTAHGGFRSILVGAGDRAYVVDRSGGLLAYDPEAGDLAPSDVSIGAGRLRAATTPMPDGTVFGVTQDPSIIFELGPDETVRTLGEVDGYIASLARTPDGSRLFWVPYAHGTANQVGTPVMTMDTETGEVETFVSLDDLAVDALGLHLGGSYDVVVDPSGDRLYVGLNGGADAEEPWGEVVLAVISLDGGGLDPS